MTRGPKPETMTPERRAEISAATKARMADPAIRAKISRRTKDGLLAAQNGLFELRDLRTAWKRARPEIRKRFLAETLDALWLDAKQHRAAALAAEDMAAQ